MKYSPLSLNVSFPLNKTFSLENLQLVWLSLVPFLEMVTQSYTTSHLAVSHVNYTFNPKYEMMIRTDFHTSEVRGLSTNQVYDG